MISVRTYRPEDEAAVVALWQACDLTRPWNDPSADIERAMAGTTSSVLIGEQGERVVASAMVGHDGHRGWIYYVAVEPGIRGEGLGRQIMEHAEAWLRERGAVKVVLMIREGNESVRGFYQQLGYELEPRLVMSRWLDRSVD